MMLLAFDTSSAACTVALFDDDGACVASRDEHDRPRPCRAAGADDRRGARRAQGEPHPGRGRTGQLHRHPRRDCGRARPGDRLERRSRRACRRWHCWPPAPTGDGEVAAAVTGGHGELFVQQFNARHGRTDVGAAEPATQASGRRHRARSWSSDPAPRRWSTRAAGAKRAKRGPRQRTRLHLPEALRSLAAAARSMRARPTRAYRRRPDGHRGATRAYRCRIVAGPRRGDARDGRRVRRSLRRGMDALAAAPESCRWPAYRSCWRASPKAARQSAFHCSAPSPTKSELLLIAVLPSQHRRRRRPHVARRLYGPGAK